MQPRYRRHGRYAPVAAIPAARHGRGAALLRRSLLAGPRVGQEGRFLTVHVRAAAGKRIALRHRDVVLVECELTAVDPGAEAEVAGQDEEKPRDDAGDDGGDVGSRMAF